MYFIAHTLDFFLLIFDSSFHILKNQEIKSKKDKRKKSKTVARLMSKVAYISFVVALLAAVNLIPHYSNKDAVDVKSEKSDLIYVSTISVK